MITVIHGGQTGTDRGAHAAAIDNGWLVAGYMPRNARDERGPIPPGVARYLRPHEKTNYAARTEANVRSCDALLVVVPNAEDPRATPGTAYTLDLAERLYKRRMIVDPRLPARVIADWIWRDLLALRTLPLPLETRGHDPLSPRLMVAGPRESKWQLARLETADLLRRVAAELQAINAGATSTRGVA